MKKSIIGAVALGLAMIVGCTPSAEQINKTATAIGYVQQPVSVSVSADGEDEIMEFFPEDGNA